MYWKTILYCYQLIFAGFCGLAGMFLGCIFAFAIFFILYLFGIQGSHLDPIGFFLEAALGITFFLGGFNIADKIRKWILGRFH